MAVQDLVLIDTCIWVPFFNRPASHEKRAVDDLIDDDRAAIVGPILTEILIGFRRDARADWVAAELRGLHFVDIEWDDWRTAAQIGRQLLASGHILPQSDLILAAVALAQSVAVYTTDPHFDLIPNLKRHRV